MKKIVPKHFCSGIGKLLLTAGCILAFTCAVSAQGLLQKKITIQFQKQSLAAALLQLQNQSGISIAYTPAQVKPYEVQAASFEQTSLADILKALLKQAPLQFKESEGYIIVVPAEAKTPPAEKKPPAIPVKGQIRDAKSKQPVSGVSVFIQGTHVATLTDEEGNFTLPVTDTAAMLVVSHTGYEAQFIRIGASTDFSIVLTPDVKSLTGVVVEARRRLNTEVVLLNERKNAAIVSDGISAQNIEKTASITTTQALQRVTGVTISNDRNVAIRGLGDRNVVAQLNGARLSGANPDQNSPPLDLVPAGLLESVTVYKTVTPDKPADATAGIIELKTKAIPEKMSLSISVQTGTNTTTGVGGSFTTFKGSELGTFGQKVKQRNLPQAFYDLNKQFPQGFAQLYRFMNDSRNSPALSDQAFAIDKMEKAIPPVLMNAYRNAAPNQIYTLGFGNTFKLGNEQRIGLVLALNYYKRTTEKYNGVLNQYSIYQGGPLSTVTIPPYTDPNNLNLGKFIGYRENTGNEQLNAGGLATLTYQLNKRNEVSVHFMMNQGAQDGATHLDGRYENTGMNYTITNQVYQLTQSYRTFNTLQFRGEHKLTAGDYAPQLSWNVSGSRATELDPDYRFFSLIADSNVYNGSPIHDLPGGDVNSRYFQPLRAYVSLPGIGGVNIDPNGRKYRELTENNRNYTLDFTLPFKAGGQKQQLKLGGYYLNKERHFSEYVLYLPDQQSTSSLTNDLFKYYGNLNAYVGTGNIGFSNGSDYEGQWRKVGFLYYPQKTFNNYSGVQRATALYGMADLKLGKQLRAVGGVRLESTTISGTVDTVGASIDPAISSYTRVINPVITYKVKLEPYYSGSIIYTLNQDMNFRLAYATTLARPELREMMPTLAFDPFQYAVVQGNTALQNQKSSNLDFRWEWFPASGEVFSVSAFYKKIDRQLTKVFANDSSSANPKGATYNIIRYQNDPEQGKVYGLEFELRKNIGLLSPDLRNFFLGTNLLLARSVIKKNKERLDASRAIDRYASAYSPVFEQPPYALNAYLDYDNKKSGTNATLSFNVVGARLVQVRLTGEPDIYDHPVPMLDFVFSQRLYKRLVLKAFIKNILDPQVQQYYAIPGNSYTKFHGRTYLNSSYRQGREVAVGFTYNMF